MGIRATIIILLIAQSCYSQEVHEHPTIRWMHHVNNSIRQRMKLEPQRLSPVLSKAAQYQAEFMAKTHDFRHNANGSPGRRANKYGYDGIVVENLARSYNSVEGAFYAWTESPEHWHAIIADNSEVGYGYSIADDGTTYWVVVYGSPRDKQWSERPTKPQTPTNRAESILITPFKPPLTSTNISTSSSKLFVKPQQLSTKHQQR